MTFVPETTPYRWPFDGSLDPDRTALLVCGAGPAWSSRTPLDDKVEANIERLRTKGSTVGVAVVLLDHHEPVRPYVIGEPTPPPLEPRADETEVEAAGIDGFYGSPLDPVLRALGRDLVLFVGRGFETTVHSTLRRANDRGYECLTIADACASLEPTTRAASISSIEMSGGIFGAVGSTDDVIAALTHPQPEALL